MKTNNKDRNKSELAADIVRRTGHERKQVEQVLDEAIRAIRTALAGGGTVRLSGLGKFTLALWPARFSKHPKTGRRQWCEARTTVQFKPSGVLRDALRGEEEEAL